VQTGSKVGFKLISWDTASIPSKGSCQGRDATKTFSYENQNRQKYFTEPKSSRIAKKKEQKIANRDHLFVCADTKGEIKTLLLDMKLG
jgi:mRNA degradation ribonuclease J1/J2